MSAIRIIDINSFSEASSKNFKSISMQSECEHLCEEKLITSFSRYEVLGYRWKLMLDIERIPFDKPDMIYDIIENFNKFMKHKNAVKVDMDYVLTMNTSSPNHKGLSYHLIFYEYSALRDMIKYCLLEFVHTDFGKEFIDYIDTSIYTNNRLMKLPYYIGITKQGIDTNADNYHRIIKGDPMHPDKFIVQITDETINVSCVFEHNKEWEKGVVNISGGNKERKEKKVKNDDDIHVTTDEMKALNQFIQIVRNFSELSHEQKGIISNITISELMSNPQEIIKIINPIYEELNKKNLN